MSKGVGGLGRWLGRRGRVKEEPGRHRGVDCPSVLSLRSKRKILLEGLDLMARNRPDEEEEEGE